MNDQERLDFIDRLEEIVRHIKAGLDPREVDDGIFLPGTHNGEEELVEGDIEDGDDPAVFDAEDVLEEEE